MMTRRSAVTAALALCAALAVAPTSGPATAVGTVDVVDGVAAVDPDDAPQRVISLSPSITEWLFALGAGGQVVAVDSYSNHPPDAPTTELSGFQPNVEALAAYEPDLVLLSSDRDGIVAALTAAGIPTVVVRAPADVDGLRANVLAIGAAVGRDDEAVAAVEQLDADLAAAIGTDTATTGTDAPATTTASETTRQTYYWELSDAFHTVTSDTLIGSLIAPLGLTSIADGVDPAAGAYPQLSSEAVLAADPDLIVIAWASGSSPPPDEVAARPGWPTLTTAADGRIVVLDSDVATRWGPRVVELVVAVAAASV